MKKNVNIYLADDLHPKGISLLERSFNLLNIQGLSNSRLLKQILTHTDKTNSTESALIIRSVRNIDKDFIAAVSKTNIRLICTVSAGYDNIDLAAAKKFKIDVMNVAGANSTSAAEFTLGVILAIAKNLIPASVDMKKGKFDYSRYKNYELYGKTLGIIGVGRIGSKVAGLARAFGMKINGNDINRKVKAKYPFIKFTSLNSLITTADIVTIHTPLKRTTENIINSKNIKLFSKSAILVNCSRGGTVDEKALINALANDKLHYAAVDVFETEPGFRKNFTKLDNILLTPHLAGKTAESKQRMGLEAAEKVRNYFTKQVKKDKLVY